MTRTITQNEYLQYESNMSDIEDEYDPDIIRPSDPVRLIPSFSFVQFRKLVQYEILVECWKHKESGRGRREWLKQFEEKERRTIERYHRIAYKWYLVDGPPKRVSMHINTLNLLRRAVAFFATI
jgi:hypothetical protein